ncbi:MAG: ABC transporter substrate-binding protein [Thermotogota bacterium]|nr:ABC transporter substrate-binding protein [Thermotogota bacterium]
MRMNKLKSTILVGVILSLFVASSVAIQPTNVQGAEAFFTLVAKTNGGGVRPDYLNFLQQHLARIGINVDVIVQDWPSFVMELIFYRNFDICYVALVGGGADPDMMGVYDENGSLNLFGYDTSMDYDPDLGTGKNQWYMEEGNLIMPPDSGERIQHYWEWEQYLMDKICPLHPTFAPKSYVAMWSNLQGYNFTDGLFQSWGKMSWDGSHQGQESTSEFVMRDAAWSDLNPLFQDDASSSTISSATMDPLIWYDADLTAWPHLAESWTQLNDTHVRINIREGIKWQPDPDGEFLTEDFDAEDVYFTLYAWATVSNDPQLWDWIKSMDIVDDYTIDIYIDGSPSTPGDQPYAPYLPSLATRMLPEHYLNQSQLSDGVTPDTTHPAWDTFATHCFGTGLFEFASFQEGVETQLTVFDNCWRMDGTLTADPALNWEERFGTFVGGLDTLRIRIIPDTQTALLEFENGKLDYVGVTAYPEKRDAYLADPDFEIQSDTTFYFGFFGYNMRESREYIGSRDPCPNDESLTIGLAVRKAISYAIDRYEINDVIHRGEYTISDHPIYKKQGVWCNPNIIRYDHNLDLAREYMEKAGFSFTSEIPTTSVTPGFGFWVTLASMLAVSTATFVIYKRRK